MIGNPFEPKDLVEPEAQEILQRWFLLAARRLAVDQPIECGLPAHDAIDQLLAETPVGSAQARHGQGRFQDLFYKPIPASLPEGGQCNFSWFFAAHNL